MESHQRLHQDPGEQPYQDPGEHPEAHLLLPPASLEAGKNYLDAFQSPHQCVRLAECRFDAAFDWTGVQRDLSYGLEAGGQVEELLHLLEADPAVSIFLLLQID